MGRNMGGLTHRQIYLDRVIGGIALIALHEAGSVQGHIESTVERLRVAREARGLRQLVDDQLDLVPESRNRWRRDHEVRLALWRGLARDLKPPRRRKAKKI
jgi:hypothetical protein